MSLLIEKIHVCQAEFAEKISTQTTEHCVARMLNFDWIWNAQERKYEIKKW